MPNKSPLEGENIKIILIMLLGWTCFSLADANAKNLSAGYDPSLIITLTASFNFIVIGGWILVKRGIKGFISEKWKLLAFRGFLTGVTSFGVVNALSLIPIADLYGITFSAPFISVILSVLLLKESVGWHRWLTVVAGFIGVVILIGPQFNTLNIGISHAIVATLCIAFSTIVVRFIGTKEYMPLIIWYSGLGMLAVNAPIAISVGTLPAIPDLIYFLTNGVLILAAMLMTTYALAHAKSTASVAPFVYIQAIWGIVFGIIFFGDTPNIATISGLIIIVSAGLYMLYRERQLNR